VTALEIFCWIIKTDGFVKSRFYSGFVIPAEAGIQLNQAVLGSRLRGSDGFLTFYEIIKTDTRELFILDVPTLGNLGTLNFRHCILDLRHWPVSSFPWLPKTTVGPGRNHNGYAAQRSPGLLDRPEGPPEFP
jgi:hypothetical protein